MRTWCGVSLVMLLLGGCGQSSSSPSRGELEAFAETQSQNLVKQKLRDPDSAQFRNVRTSYKSGKLVVCGEVNSTNGFGGKAGFQRFVSNGGGAAFLEEEMQNGSFDEVAAKEC